MYRAPVDQRSLPYLPMSLETIRALPLPTLAHADCRLFLWTTNRWLPAAFGLLDGWNFAYKQTLVWHKTDANLPGHVAPNSAEFVLVGTRGKPERLTTMPSAVIATTRYGGPGVPSHSRKRECWLDYFELVSPAPRAELFARRARFGWDYPIGDQSLGGRAA